MMIASCSKDNLSGSSGAAGSVSSTLLAVGQTSAQLASGSTFSVQVTPSGTTIDTSHTQPHPDHCKNDGMGSFLNGTDFLTPTNELIAIVDAESAGDMRGLRMYGRSGATITNYDAAGNVVTLPLPPAGGPEGVSFSGGEFAHIDSLLKTIVKTVVDFGAGIAVKHDSITITRAGKIVITRAVSGQQVTETVTFESYSVNGNAIEGTKTRINTFDPTTGVGSATTSVANGKITFNTGVVATWTGSRARHSTIVLDANKHPLSGTVTTTATTTVTGSDGTVIYSHTTTNPVVENIACGGAHRWPVSGTVETDYKTNKVIIDFGDGTCANKDVTVTINGVTTTKVIGG